MSSLFFSQSSARERQYKLPKTLKHKDILAILRNHFLLSQIFWPHCSSIVKQKASTQYDVSCFAIDMPNIIFKSTLCNHEDGVICTEDLGLGGKVTITYTLVEHEKESHLVEERSLTAVKLLTPFLKHGEGPVLKTKNLLQVLESLGAGREVMSALSELNGGLVCGNGGSLIEKAGQV